MSESKPIYKHVFLEYGEYQRLLNAKKRNDELLQKVKTLEKQVDDLQKDQGGKGLETIVDPIFQEKRQNPLIEWSESITTPPSARMNNSVKTATSSLWYFLGVPDDESK